MWNAYTTTNPALPSRDVRVKNLTVDGSIITQFDSFDATITQEDGTTGVYEIAVLKIGDIVNLFIPDISVNALTYSQAYKSLPIPLEYQPVAAGQSQAIVTSQNAAPGVGSCYFDTTSVIRLFTRADRNNPANNFPAIVRSQTISYFKSL